ncbi:hypothetical protein [Streptomyces silaceus]|uniref:hypothetical protein n=1 Tax=Streptomyces silaceus TaxID=545123 RepID=UPI0006EB4161|nr:hypothetical protein [Streptomyces silaceus]
MSARAEILAALMRGGYSEDAAVSLMSRADKEPQTSTGTGDPEFPTTLAGGHALVVEYGDCEFHGCCQCGMRLGTVTPDKFSSPFGLPWERHVMRQETGR